MAHLIYFVQHNWRKLPLAMGPRNRRTYTEVCPLLRRTQTNMK